MTTTNTHKSLTHSNPWLAGLWIATALAGLVGVGLTTSNSDSTAPDYDATAADLGHTLLGVGGVMLAGLLVAGAICWQLRRR